MPNEIHPGPAEFTDAEIDGLPLLYLFHYSHLPPALQESSRPFCELARRIYDTIPAGAERTVALRKLKESKDAAVCAVVIAKRVRAYE